MKTKLVLASIFLVSATTPLGNVSATERSSSVELMKGAGELTQQQFSHFTPIKMDSMTEAERGFVEEAKKKKPGVYPLGNLYVITLGEKPNAGYGIEFVESQTSFEKESICVKLTKPSANDSNAQVITYPYIVGRLDLPSKYMSIEVINAENGNSVFEETGKGEENPFNSVDINKEWTIRFNVPLKKETITEENIYIYEKANGTAINKFPVEITIMGDLQTVKVKPKTKYKYGQQYILFISKQVSSIQNIKMENDRVQPFTTLKAIDV